MRSILIASMAVTTIVATLAYGFHRLREAILDDLDDIDWEQ